MFTMILYTFINKQNHDVDAWAGVFQRMESGIHCGLFVKMHWPANGSVDHERVNVALAVPLNGP
jgi:hypothetical protein